MPRSVYYAPGRNGATDYSLQERRECPRLTPSTRRCPQNCICTMAWRFTKVERNSHTGEYSILLYLNAQDGSHRDHGGALRAGDRGGQGRRRRRAAGGS